MFLISKRFWQLVYPMNSCSRDQKAVTPIQLVSAIMVPTWSLEDPATGVWVHAATRRFAIEHGIQQSDKKMIIANRISEAVLTDMEASVS
jgi:hypothetical protein